MPLTAHRARRPAGVVVLVIALSLGVGLFGRGAGADPPPLGRAEPFAVLGGETVTNVGPTIIFGHLGVSPGTAVTGDPDVRGEIHVGPASRATGAQLDARAAYVHLATEPCPPANDLTGSDLGGRTLAPGVYCFSSDAQLTGTLTLDFEGIPNALFVFKIGTMLTTASASVVRVINAAGQTNPCNVFWQVGSSATLGTNSNFLGTIIADQSITAGSGTDVLGRLFALVGQVSLNDNTVTRPVCALPPTTTTTAPTTTTVPPTTTTVPPTTTTVPPTTTTAAPTTTTTVPPTTTTVPLTTTTTPPTTIPIPLPTITIPVPTISIPLPTITIPLPTITIPQITIPQITSPQTTITTTAPTTTTLAPGTTATTQASGTTTVDTGNTTTTVGAGTTTTTTDQASPGATTTAGPGAGTASLGVLISPTAAGLASQALARTGEGLSGPLSVAIVSMFLGALLLLVSRRGVGVPPMAVSQFSGVGRVPGALDRPPWTTSARINASTVVEGDRCEVRTAPGAGQPTPGAKQPPEPGGEVGAGDPGPGDLLEALERQLQAADARLARLRAMHGLG